MSEADFRTVVQLATSLDSELQRFAGFVTQVFIVLRAAFIEGCLLAGACLPTRAAAAHSCSGLHAHGVSPMTG
jgi:hypothetical protein